MKVFTGGFGQQARCGPISNRFTSPLRQRYIADGLPRSSQNDHRRLGNLLRRSGDGKTPEGSSDSTEEEEDEDAEAKPEGAPAADEVRRTGLEALARVQEEISNFKRNMQELRETPGTPKWLISFATSLEETMVGYGNSVVAYLENEMAKTELEITELEAEEQRMEQIFSGLSKANTYEDIYTTTEEAGSDGSVAVGFELVLTSLLSAFFGTFPASLVGLQAGTDLQDLHWDPEALAVWLAWSTPFVLSTLVADFALSKRPIALNGTFRQLGTRAAECALPKMPYTVLLSAIRADSYGRGVVWQGLWLTAMLGALSPADPDALLLYGQDNLVQPSLGSLVVPSSLASPPPALLAALVVAGVEGMAFLYRALTGKDE
jgi:hypothetical protein